MVDSFLALLKRTRRYLREAGDLRLLRSSGLFDEVWYLAHNPDVAQAKLDPVLHYLRYGGFEGRDPGPSFCSSWYLEAYEDVKEAGINPLVHYLKYGRVEGRVASNIAAPPLNYESQVETHLRLDPGSEIRRKLSYPRTRVVDRKKISVIVTSYNHEQYISQCLESILIQKGYFNLEIILGDDCSKDKTRKIMQQYYEIYPGIIKIMLDEPNMGISKNLKRCLDASTGDFIAVCEGDDYWTDENKLQKQMEYLEENEDCSMCFSALMILIEEENRFILHEGQNNLKKDTITTEDLIESNYIGNFSCCMYRTDVIRKLPLELFNIETADWMFNMACGNVGKIGFIRDPMSVYRIHSNGFWSGMSTREQNDMILLAIDIYDRFFNYKYEVQFTRLRNRIKDQNS
jgi:glycosyltransferase involved in cell wall biosynthesis